MMETAASSPTESSAPIVCDHGSLKRKCPICERDEVIAHLTEALRLSRRNVSTLNAARADRGYSQFDAWLEVLDQALTWAPPK